MLSSFLIPLFAVTLSGTAAQAFDYSRLTQTLDSQAGGRAVASVSASDKGVSTKPSWQMDSSGKVDFDKSKWSHNLNDDGTDLYSSKDGQGAEETRAILKVMNKDGSTSEQILSISDFRIENKKETSVSILFSGHDLKALSRCTEEGKDGLRRCMTVTPDFCKALPGTSPNKSLAKNLARNLNSFEMKAASLSDLDMAERRAVATILTLRGSDYQMQNVAKTGNILGYKDNQQMTRGRLLQAKIDDRTIAEAHELCGSKALAQN